MAETNITKIVIFIVTFVLVFYISFNAINMIWPNTKSINALTVILPNAITLSRKTMVGSSDAFAEPFFKGNGGSLLFYVKLEPGQRTRDIQNPYSTIISVDNCLSLDIPIAPDAGQVNKTNNGRLQIVNDKGQTETIELPAIPYQKWIQVAFLREGRRFDVMYNDKTVVSQRLKHLPAIRKNGLNAGSEGLIGEFGLVRVASRRLTVGEIQYEHTKTSDTRGNPNLRLTAVGTNCPDGTYCPETTTTPPRSPLMFWGSPYR